MKLKELIENNILEDLQLVKFSYNKDTANDPEPEAKVLDFNYPGQEGQSTYGNREDLLGFNLNYFSNKEYATKAIDEIDGFARLLSANKDEKYRRLKHFYPEVTKYIRRYNRDHIEDIKVKYDDEWNNTDYDELAQRDKESF